MTSVIKEAKNVGQYQDEINEYRGEGTRYTLDDIGVKLLLTFEYLRLFFDGNAKMIEKELLNLIYNFTSLVFNQGYVFDQF